LQTIRCDHTLDEYRKYIEKDAPLERRFQPVQVGEPTVEHTIEILKGLRDRYEGPPPGVHHRWQRSWPPPPWPTAYINDRFAGQGDRPDRRGRCPDADPTDDGSARPARLR
jgi:hypothetical protein